MSANWLEETWGPIFEKEEKAKKFSFKETYQKKELGKDWYEGEIDKARNIWKHTPEGVKNAVTGTASGIGKAYSETMWKARRGMLGPHAFVGSHVIDTIGKVTGTVSEFATEQVHDKLGIHKPLARGGVMVGEALLARKIPKVASKFKQTATGYKEALYGLGGTGGAGATRGAGKGKFRRTKTTDKLHRLIDESKEAELAKQLGYANADAIESGLRITPDKTGTIRFDKVNSQEGNALRLALLNRTKELLKENNIPISKYRQVRGKLSKEFPTEIGGEGREFSGIGKALRADDPSKISFPLAKTRGRAKDQRSKVTAPPAKGDLYDLADDIDMPRDQVHEFIQDSQRTFANVKKAAARESAFPGEFHAGHLTAAASDVVPAYDLYPRSRKTITSNINDPTIPLEADTPGRMRYPPTSGEAATIELGVDNIRGSNKLVHNINPNVARWAGVADTWAELMKSWWKRKQGKGTKDFFSDWNQTERDALMDIPYDMPRKEALKRFRKIEAMRNQRGDMGYKEIQKELKLQLDEDNRFLDWQSSIGILGRSKRALYT